MIKVCSYEQLFSSLEPKAQGELYCRPFSSIHRASFVVSKLLNVHLLENARSDFNETC